MEFPPPSTLSGKTTANVQFFFLLITSNRRKGKVSLSPSSPMTILDLLPSIANNSADKKKIEILQFF